VSDHLDVRSIPRESSPLDTLRRYWYLVVLLLCAGGAFLYWWRFYAFNDMGYAPIQPIPYSHKLHAGELGIDCQYCHFNAERGKHAGAPPVSVCLGCHAPDKGAAGQDRPGVQKLLALTVDNETGSYADADDLDGGDRETLEAGGVIHWNRVHKLPDHAYFSHEWHVKADVACQTCHGPIETMEVVYQHAPLEMGWCIDCHRNDNYVGGPDYDGTAETFTVGTANYDILRQRIRPDQAVAFPPRPTQGHEGHAHDAHGHEEHGHGEHAADADHAEASPYADRDGQQLRGLFPEGTDDDLHNTRYVSGKQLDKLNELFAHYRQDDTPDLPRWRIPDLPEVHALFYRGADQDGDGLIDDPALLKDPAALGTFQNAPTQCSTCHQ